MALATITLKLIVDQDTPSLTSQRLMRETTESIRHTLVRVGELAVANFARGQVLSAVDLDESV